MARVFVYGTLKRRRGNHGILGNAVFIGEAITKNGGFTMYDGGFPYVSDDIVDDSNGHIIGELYETDSKVILENLDRLEGVPHLYVRKDVPVIVLDTNIEYESFMYVASGGTNERLKQRVPMKPKGRQKLLEWN